MMNPPGLCLFNLFPAFIFMVASAFFLPPVMAAPTIEPSPTPSTTPTPVPFSYDNHQAFGPWQDGRDLGEVSFTLSEPVTETARAGFITGLKLLHAFEYPEARAAFRQAQEDNKSADFIMGIWGELMCDYQLLWYTRDFAGADQILLRLEQARRARQDSLSISEITLLDAASKLFGNDDDSRHKQPHEQGSNIQLFYQVLNEAVSSGRELEPEIRVFRNLAWLGTRKGILDYPLEREVIADLITMRSDPQWTNHPGLNHYLIHASESPVLTVEYLADAYEAANWLRSLSEASNNTSSVHLIHMPAHFYFANGDWVNSCQVNALAWQKSLDRASDLKLSDSSLAFHEHLWRIYSLLQAGQINTAISDNKDLYQRLQNSGSASDAETRVLRTYYAFEYAFLILELPKHIDYRSELESRSLSINLMSGWGLTAYHFTEAWLALQKKHYDSAEISRNTLNALLTDASLSLSPANIDAIPVMVQQLMAEEQRQRGDLTSAIKLARAVANDYRNMRWDHGVPLVVKPLLEYLGDLMLDKAREDKVTYQRVTNQPVRNESSISVVILNQEFSEARAYYQNELQFFPRRKLSLLGLKEVAWETGYCKEYYCLTELIGSLARPINYNQILNPASATYSPVLVPTPSTAVVYQVCPSPTGSPDSGYQNTATVLTVLALSIPGVLDGL